MTTEEKLRFLLDRMEDEKEFYIGGLLYKYYNGALMIAYGETEKGCKFIKSMLTRDSAIRLSLELK